MTKGMDQLPPEGLEEQVRDAVDRRLGAKTFLSTLNLQDFGPLRTASAIPIASFAVATQQRLSIGQLQRMRRPNSWLFLIQLVDKAIEKDSPRPETSDLYVLAAATITPSGDYEYASTLNPKASARLAEIFVPLAGKANSIAVLEMPTYYLQAIWLRTNSPSSDRLAFFGETFGRFPVGTPEEPRLVPLEELVNYANRRLSSPYYPEHISSESMK